MKKVILKNTMPVKIIAVHFLFFVSAFMIISCSFGKSENNEKNVVSSAGNETIKIQLPAIGDTITGKVVAVIDGDTYDVLVKGDTSLRVRMEGIDAPEKGMAFYKVAKKYLSDLCFGKNVKVLVTGIDGHSRVLGFTFVDDNLELSHEMIKAGYAWHFKKYSKDKNLASLEQEARKAGIGLWYDENPIAPWEFRKLMRQGNTAEEIYREHNKNQ
ncbi:MAG TPA: thermonuclease family protein [Bacteroidales bacterium]|nr:thermonuclease family protein [Bacteroidales bacterium]HQI70042.1 thermonuclease family protein [Bacteroidales bacterium]